MYHLGEAKRTHRRRANSTPGTRSKRVIGTRRTIRFQSRRRINLYLLQCVEAGNSRAENPAFLGLGMRVRIDHHWSETGSGLRRRTQSRWPTCPTPNKREPTKCSCNELLVQPECAPSGLCTSATANAGLKASRHFVSGRIRARPALRSRNVPGYGASIWPPGWSSGGARTERPRSRPATSTWAGRFAHRCRSHNRAGIRADRSPRQPSDQVFPNASVGVDSRQGALRFRALGRSR
ncbi:hypothetical protein CLV78_101395 [Aliiruegeria haliotis]|uniref:Uncharacterized protein n=1 Tax=Aliiruegeria haliotis TaxID=1280846 RepID=A0A2T0RYS1_9RHOB|nr:hypothetical protein CLV78_101395 [Aliiruegeria haliotis]